MQNRDDGPRPEEYLVPYEDSAFQPLLFEMGRETRIHESAVESHASLAELALAVHQHAPRLRPAELEQAVRWLKAWKALKQPLRRPGDRFQVEMSRALKRLRESPEQLRLQNRTWRQSALSRFAAVLLSALVFLALVLHGPEWRWYHYASVVVLLLSVFGWTEHTFYRAIETAKEQDRRYFLACLREAQTVSELNKAGFFAYTGFEPGNNFDIHEWKTMMREECERLSDALYRDPDDVLVRL